MIKFISYCSYTGSSVGFAMGYVDLNIDDNDDIIELQEYRENDLIVKAFENGLVTSVYGKFLPYTDEQMYVFLVKGCHFSDNDNLVIDGKKVYLNFAFSFDKEKEYENFKNGISMVELQSAACKFIVIDQQDNKFGIRINCKELKQFINDTFDNPANNAYNNDLLTIVTESENDYTDKLEFYFGLKYSNFILKKQDKEYILLKRSESIDNEENLNVPLSGEKINKILKEILKNMPLGVKYVMEISK